LRILVGRCSQIEALEGGPDAVGDVNDELIAGVMPHTVVDELEV
jgi:hypothetical protein